MQIPILDLDAPATWPEPLRAALAKARNWSEPWFNESPGRGGAYDELHAYLTPELQTYALRGWHCTRLRDREVELIRQGGLQIPSEDLLHRRLESARSDGEMPAEVASHLRVNNQAGRDNRRGKLWFGFSDDLLSEGAISRLLRHWGGESLYWSHEDDEKIAPILRHLGRPTIIDAWVPVPGLRTPLQLVDLLCKVDLQNAGLMEHSGVARFESYSTLPISAESIIRIDQFPGAAFEHRTRCGDWREPLE